MDRWFGHVLKIGEPACLHDENYQYVRSSTQLISLYLLHKIVGSVMFNKSINQRVCMKRIMNMVEARQVWLYREVWHSIRLLRQGCGVKIYMYATNRKCGGQNLHGKKYSTDTFTIVSYSSTAKYWRKIQSGDVSTLYIPNSIQSVDNMLSKSCVCLNQIISMSIKSFLSCLIETYLKTKNVIR